MHDPRCEEILKRIAPFRFDPDRDKDAGFIQKFNKAFDADGEPPSSDAVEYGSHIHKLAISEAESAEKLGWIATWKDWNDTAGILDGEAHYALAEFLESFADNPAAIKAAVVSWLYTRCGIAHAGKYAEERFQAVEWVSIDYNHAVGVWKIPWRE